MCSTRVSSDFISQASKSVTKWKVLWHWHQTELHQHEIVNINSGIKDMEEKVFYQSEERLIDIRENLSSLETKLNSLEHQVSLI